VRIFAGIVVVPQVLTTVIAVGKQAAVARFLSVLLVGALVLLGVFPASSEQAALAAQCYYLSAALAQWSLLLQAGCDDARGVCQTALVLLYAVD
jgi:hypothetical protein